MYQDSKAVKQNLQKLEAVGSVFRRWFHESGAKASHADGPWECVFEDKISGYQWHRCHGLDMNDCLEKALSTANFGSRPSNPGEAFERAESLTKENDELKKRLAELTAPQADSKPKNSKG